MKKLLFLLLISLTGCATFQVSTLDHTPTYVVESINTKIRVIDNEFELHRLLRTNINPRDNTNRPNTVRVTKKIKTTHIPNSRVIKSNPIPRQRFNIPTRTKSTPNLPVRSNTSTSTRSNSRRKN